MRRTFLASLSEEEARFLRDDWAFWAHAAQRPPPGDWRVWVFLGGRGAGKTSAGAAWIRALARAGRCARMALIGPTLHDVREVMIEGPAGVRAWPGDRPFYEVSRRRLVWANGAEAFGFSAEDPDSLRGPQFDAAWADELCYWAAPDETLAALGHAMRLGAAPRLAVTTTPRPIAALKALIARPDAVVTRATTWDNADKLAPDFLLALRARWTGGARDRQELAGELVEDFAGALWRRAALEALRAEEIPPFERIVVAVDPPASAGAKADACGIVAAGAYTIGEERRAIVLADSSVQGLTPSAWAGRAAALARTLEADAIVAEANNGGELVRAVLRLAAPDMPIRLVHASIAKRARAEPIAVLYDRGCVTHARAFAELEDEMCAFGAPGFSASPDRLDALVWALTDLLLDGAAPRLRPL